MYLRIRQPSNVRRQTIPPNYFTKAPIKAPRGGNQKQSRAQYWQSELTQSLRPIKNLQHYNNLMQQNSPRKMSKGRSKSQYTQGRALFSIFETKLCRRKSCEGEQFGRPTFKSLKVGSLIPYNQISYFITMKMREEQYKKMAQNKHKKTLKINPSKSRKQIDTMKGNATKSSVFSNRYSSNTLQEPTQTPIMVQKSVFGSQANVSDFPIINQTLIPENDGHEQITTSSVIKHQNVRRSKSTIASIKQITLDVPQSIPSISHLRLSRQQIAQLVNHSKLHGSKDDFQVHYSNPKSQQNKVHSELNERQIQSNTSTQQQSDSTKQKQHSPKVQNKHSVSIKSPGKQQRSSMGFIYGNHFGSERSIQESVVDSGNNQDSCSLSFVPIPHFDKKDRYKTILRDQRKTFDVIVESGNLRGNKTLKEYLFKTPKSVIRSHRTNVLNFENQHTDIIPLKISLELIYKGVECRPKSKQQGLKQLTDGSPQRTNNIRAKMSFQY